MGWVGELSELIERVLDHTSARMDRVVHWAEVRGGGVGEREEGGERWASVLSVKKRIDIVVKGAWVAIASESV